MTVDQLASAFKALSSPHRLAIYLRLAECCAPGTDCDTRVFDANRCVGEIASGLNLAPSTVSHHLKELRQAGLIGVDKQGQKSLCYVDPEMLGRLKQFFGALENGSTLNSSSGKVTS